MRKEKPKTVNIYAGSRDVTKPTAQYMKQCDHESTDIPELKALKSILDKLSTPDNQYYQILLLQLRGALRISEVLNITYLQILDNESIYIKGLKGSNDKVVYVPELKEIITKWKKYKMKPYKDISRFSVYRFYKRLGISFPKRKGKVSNVTHAVRNIVIKSMRARNLTETEIASIIGHRSVKSTGHYG